MVRKTGAVVVVVAVAAAAAPAAAVPAGKVRALFRAKTTTVIERVASRPCDLQRPIKSLPAGGYAEAFEICRHSARTSQGRCPSRILKPKLLHCKYIPNYWRRRPSSSFFFSIFFGRYTPSNKASNCFIESAEQTTASLFFFVVLSLERKGERKQSKRTKRTEDQVISDVRAG